MKVTAETDKQRWERDVLEPALEKAPERAGPSRRSPAAPSSASTPPTTSPDFDYRRDLNHPGDVSLHARHPSRPATAASSGRCGSLPGSARRKRPTSATRRCSQAGGTGLSVAFDLPTLMGRDPDHELSLGEVGKCGVSIVSLADMERLFDGIALADITTSMTINSPAPMIFAMYLVVAEQQGADWKTLSGTIQNDILKEFIAQKEYIYPPRESMRLITDVFAFCAKEVPRWNTVSVSGYHIREAGSTALQELAFTLRDGIEYVQYGIDAGLDVDDFAPRISFFFNSHSDFFEEIAKFRAARKLWAEVMRDRFRRAARAIVEAALPHADRRRLAHRAAALQQRRPHGAAGAGGGASAAPTRSTPTRSTRRWRCRPPRPRRSRCGRSRSSRTRAASTNTVDPLGGSYFVERLTLDMERGAKEYFDDHRSAWAGWSRRSRRAIPQREIAEASYRFQQAVERREKVIVGVNDFVQDDEPPMPILYIDETTAETQLARLEHAARRRATTTPCAARSTRCATTARGTGNTMYPLLDCVRAYATVGEMCDALREVWGEYEEVPLI